MSLPDLHPGLCGQVHVEVKDGVNSFKHVQILGLLQEVAIALSFSFFLHYLTNNISHFWIHANQGTGTIMMLFTHTLSSFLLIFYLI